MGLCSWLRFAAPALIAALVLEAHPAQACTNVTPVACPNCFAVFVMPDTQAVWCCDVVQAGWFWRPQVDGKLVP